VLFRSPQNPKTPTVEFERTVNLFISSRAESSVAL